MKRRHILKWSTAAGLAMGAGPLRLAWAEDLSAADFISKRSSEVLDIIRSDPKVREGDVEHILDVVDARIKPYLNFRRMTASATGPGWRDATPEQRQRLQDEFEKMLVRTYAGALKEVGDQTVDVLPVRAAEDAKQVLVKTLIRGAGPDPIQVDYRLERTPGESDGWKIYDVNVVGVWLVANYRTQFSQEIRKGGVEGLIKALSDHNMSAGVAS